MIIVTGGAGFIGSHLVQRLVGDGERVVVFDSFHDYYPPEVKWKNVSDLLRREAIDLVVGDIRDARAVARALEGRNARAIVHLAARAGVRPSLLEPALYSDVNVTGTMHVLEAARQAEISRVVVASSSSVYGDVEKVPFVEGQSEGVPASPYGASKRAMEVVARTFAGLHGLQVTALRFFTAYGPRQRPDMAIHKFARRILEGEPINIYGRGDTRRDYTFVDDVVDGIVRAIDRDGPAYREYNLGREESIELSGLIDALERVLGRTAERNYQPEQQGDVRVTSADCSRARTELGYEPRVSLEDGLVEFARWLQRG